MPSYVDRADECLLGSGKVYLDRFVSGAPSGNLIYLGNCKTFEVTPSAQSVELRSSSSSTRDLLRSDQIGTDLDVNIVGNEFDPENVALNLFGTVGSYTQSTAGVSDESHTGAIQGKIIKTAFRGISSVVVTGTGGTPTYVVTDDYVIINAAEGLIYIVPGGDIADDTDLLVDYTYATQSLTKVSGMNAPDIKAYLLYVSDNPNSPEQTAEVWRVALRGNGALSLIGDDYGTWTLTGKVESDATNHPSDPHYRVIRNN